MDYRINKGAGRPIEFKGLKSQYLFFFAEGLVSVFLAVVVLYMAGVSQLVCLSFGAVSGTLAVWLTFRMNARYGEHGLMKMLAEKRHPRYLSARRRIFRDMIIDIKAAGNGVNLDDLTLCLFCLLKINNTTISKCMGASENAIRTRKSRLKEKLDPQMYQFIFGR